MSDHYEDLIGPVANFLLGEPNRAMSSKTELRYGAHGSLSIDLSKGTWYDHEAQKGGGLFDFVAYQTHCEVRESPQWLEQHHFHLPENDGPSKQNGSGQHRSAIVATYPYQDEVGRTLFEVVRFEPKTFRQRRSDGKGGYIWSVRGTRNVPYRLPELLQATTPQVFIVEGEKDVDILRDRFNVTATCNAGGVGKWRFEPDELTKFFRDADVIVIPDNDPQKKHPTTGGLMFHPDGRPIFPGQDHANEVAASLHNIAGRVRYLNLARFWREMPLKGDVYDWITRGGGTRELLDEYADKAPDWLPGFVDEPPSQPLIPILRPFPIIEKTLPVRAWNIPGLFARKHVTVLVAPSGAGKSLLTIQLGIACALKRKWAKWIPRKTFRVLFINSEDDYDEMRRRLAAAARGLSDADQAKLHNNFMIAADVVADSLIDKKVKGGEIKNGAVIAEIDPRKKTMVVTARHQQLIDTIKENKIDLIFVDPFAETFTGDENSNNDLKLAGIAWRDVARQTNAAVCLVHHTKKYATGLQGDVDAARGAGALIGIARIVSTLFPMTVKEAEVMLSKDDKPTKDARGNELDVYSKRPHYLRYDDAKANLAMISAHAKWFFKETITLDNECDEKDGDETIHIDGDDVGVLIPWESKKPTLLEEQIIKFFERVDRGELDDDDSPTGEFYTFEKKGGTDRYIGLLAQKVFDVSLKQAEEWIKGWQKNRRLEQIEYRSPSNRQKKKRVVSELSPDAPKNKRKENGGHTGENGSFNFQPGAAVVPFVAATSQFQFLGLEEGQACVKCGKTDGLVYLVRDPFRAVAAQPLHEHCAEAYFGRDK